MERVQRREFYKARKKEGERRNEEEENRIKRKGI
jgi:hypothetical protein